MLLAFDGQKYLIHKPLVTGPRPSPPELVGMLLAELAAPFADRLTSHGNATFNRQLFHIAEAQTESKGQPHSVADNLNRKTMVLVGIVKLSHNYI